jgi:hypothetical protein
VKLPADRNRRFGFHKGGQFLIGSHNEPLSVIAVRVSDPDRSPRSLHGIALESFLIAGLQLIRP